MSPRAALLPLALLAGCDDYLLPGGPPPGHDNRVDAVLALTGDAEAGADVFSARHCVACHDPAGLEDRAGPALGEAVPTLDLRALAGVVLFGLGTMPGFQGTDQEAADLLAWLSETFAD